MDFRNSNNNRLSNTSHNLDETMYNKKAIQLHLQVYFYSSSLDGTLWLCWRNWQSNKQSKLVYEETKQEYVGTLSTIASRTRDVSELIEAIGVQGSRSNWPCVVSATEMAVTWSIWAARNDRFVKSLNRTFLRHGTSLWGYVHNVYCPCLFYSWIGHQKRTH